jgi:hypothetical protein
MLLEKHPDRAGTPPPNIPAEAMSGEFWLQETIVRGIRRAIIHLADCPECENRSYASDTDQWHGPYAALNFARESSDKLTGIAMRAECRCVRREADLPSMALLNEPLFRRPEPVKERKAAKAEPSKAVATKEKKRTAKKQTSKRLRYGLLGASAVLSFCVAVVCFPAISVVEAGKPGPSPFLLTNAMYLPLTDLQADCSVVLEPASVNLRSSHQQLADDLGPNGAVSIPCFKPVGGATPQTSGMTMHVKLSYAVLGVRHVDQTFTFVAARTTNGVSKWVEKGRL